MILHVLYYWLLVSKKSITHKGCTKFHISGKSWLMIDDCLSETDLVIFQYRSSPPEVFLGKDVLEIFCKFTRKHSCWSAISIKLLCNFIEIPFWHGCSPVNLLQISRTTFCMNAYGGLLVSVIFFYTQLSSPWVIMRMKLTNFIVITWEMPWWPLQSS